MRILWAFGAVVALVMGVAPSAGADNGSVAGLDARDLFIVSGAGGTPGTGGGGDCPGCALVIVVPVCVSGITFDSPAPGTPCLTVGGRNCQPDEQFVREWTAGPAGWEQGGVSCRDLRGTPTVASIGDAVRESVRHRVPGLSVHTQPAGRALVSLPVILASGQPDRELSWQDSVAGVAVTTRVSATWLWDFGDGAVATTHLPGGRWPDDSVSHTYYQPGWYRLRVTATWSGTFEIPGLGAQPIAGEVTQNASGEVRIVTARAVLRPTRPQT